MSFIFSTFYQQNIPLKKYLNQAEIITHIGHIQKFLVALKCKILDLESKIKECNVKNVPKPTEWEDLIDKYYSESYKCFSGTRKDDITVEKIFLSLWNNKAIDFFTTIKECTESFNRSNLRDTILFEGIKSMVKFIRDKSSSHFTLNAETWENKTFLWLPKIFIWLQLFILDKISGLLGSKKEIEEM